MKAPDRSEIIPKDEYQNRMKKIGARYLPEYSNHSRLAFWVPRMKVWAIVRAEGSAMARIDYYNKASDCGCDGSAESAE